MGIMMKEHLQAVVLDRKTTFRGELAIAKAEICTVTQEDLDSLKIGDELQQLKQVFPGLNIEVVTGVCDLTIKLFAYHLRVLADDMYQQLNDILSELAVKIYSAEEDGYQLRLDITGSLDCLGRQETFRFLNKREEVSYRITGETRRFCPLRRLRKTFGEKLSRDKEKSEDED